MLKLFIDERLCESFNTVFVRLRLRELTRLKKLHFEILSLRVGWMCSDYLGHFAVEYILFKKLSVVFSDQYRPYSDMPVSFNMLLAEFP